MLVATLNRALNVTWPLLFKKALWSRPIDYREDSNGILFKNLENPLSDAEKNEIEHLENFYPRSGNKKHKMS